MANPILIELTRGDRVESVHRGALALVHADGEAALALGDIDKPVFPRSSIKAWQALPLVESGAADAFGLGKRELAVACASHSGEAVHLEAVRSLLAKAGVAEADLACGAGWPLGEGPGRELVRMRAAPTPIHNGCSGKHAGMLAVAVHRGDAVEGYEKPAHPVQRSVREAIEDLTGLPLSEDRCGIDGCSLPTWAVPLRRLAWGFARFATGSGLAPTRAAACRRLMAACFAEPLLVAGTGRLCSEVMRRLPGRVFLKGGAEGVYCAALPERGLGVALKIDDGAKRAAEQAVVAVLAALLPSLADDLAAMLPGTLRNWRGIVTGRIGPSQALAQVLEAVAVG